FFFSSRRRHTRFSRDWSSDVCSSDLTHRVEVEKLGLEAFITFALENQNLYRVVMESQFVDESIYREYYQTLANAYADRLNEAQQIGRASCRGRVEVAVVDGVAKEKSQ